MSLQAQFTREGYEKLKAQLEELKAQRVIIREEVKEARELGDLKENAGYHAAREAQGIIEARISSLEKRLDDAVIVDGASFDKVVLGVPVRVKNLATGAERTYTIVGSEEIEFTDNAASEESPIGQAILGKKVGDVVDVNGAVKMEVLAIGGA